MDDWGVKINDVLPRKSCSPTGFLAIWALKSRAISIICSRKDSNIEKWNEAVNNFLRVWYFNWNFITVITSWLVFWYLSIYTDLFTVWLLQKTVRQQTLRSYFWVSLPVSDVICRKNLINLIKRKSEFKVSRTIRILLVPEWTANRRPIFKHFIPSYWNSFLWACGYKDTFAQPWYHKLIPRSLSIKVIIFQQWLSTICSCNKNQRSYSQKDFENWFCRISFAHFSKKLQFPNSERTGFRYIWKRWCSTKYGMVIQ